MNPRKLSHFSVYSYKFTMSYYRVLAYTENSCYDATYPSETIGNSGGYTMDALRSRMYMLCRGLCAPVEPFSV